MCAYGLWVDALPIDQSDMAERMHQVRIMAQIFGGAKEVFVWLGLGNNQVDAVMRGQTHIGPRQLKWGDEHVEALGDLCARSYWRRLWVLQELKAAREITVMCGARTMPWKDFKSLLASAAKIGNNTAEWPRSALGASDYSRGIQGRILRHVTSSAAQRMVDLCNGGTPTSLWLMLQVTAHLKCYDRRDKVYSLLSMAKTESEGIDADYELPLHQLMHRVLSNLHAACRPQSVQDVLIHCSRLGDIMEYFGPWSADDYLAAEMEFVR